MKRKTNLFFDASGFMWLSGVTAAAQEQASINELQAERRVRFALAQAMFPTLDADLIRCSALLGLSFDSF